MTRDEAIVIWRNMLHPENGPKWSAEEWSRKAIDCYVALGMLKLDESKIDFNPYEGARCIFRNRFGDQIAADLLAAFHASGLAIVDAQLGKRRS